MSESTLVDMKKETWGAGPWQEEPDKLQWNHAGLACLIVRSWAGHLCGYVGVPEEHPLFKVGYSEAEDANDIEVHGGLTYSDLCDEGGGICHVPDEGFPETVWWLGFDCGHSWDYSPGSSARSARILPPMPYYDNPRMYKNLAYVKAQVEQLAGRLADTGNLVKPAQETQP